MGKIECAFVAMRNVEEIHNAGVIGEVIRLVHPW